HNGITAVLHLPVLHELLFVKAACGAPGIDALIAVEDGVRTLERSHRNQVDCDVLALAAVGELLHRPLEPVLLLGAIGNADSDGTSAGEEAAGRAGGTLPRRAAMSGARRDKIISAEDASGDKRNNRKFAQRGQLWWI